MSCGGLGCGVVAALNAGLASFKRQALRRHTISRRPLPGKTALPLQAAWGGLHVWQLTRAAFLALRSAGCRTMARRRCGVCRTR